MWKARKPVFLKSGHWQWSANNLRQCNLNLKYRVSLYVWQLHPAVFFAVEWYAFTCVGSKETLAIYWVWKAIICKHIL